MVAPQWQRNLILSREQAEASQMRQIYITLPRC